MRVGLHGPSVIRILRTTQGVVEIGWHRVKTRPLIEESRGFLVQCLRLKSPLTQRREQNE